MVAKYATALAVRGELAMIAAGGSDGYGSRAWLGVPDEIISCKSNIVLQTNFAANRTEARTTPVN